MVLRRCARGHAQASRGVRPARGVGAVRALVIPLLFLIAGLLTPPSLDRKGPGRFVRDRLLRLGVPFAVFALLLWPLPEYVLFRQLGEHPGSGLTSVPRGAWTPGFCGSSARC